MFRSCYQRWEKGMVSKYCRSWDSCAGCFNILHILREEMESRSSESCSKCRQWKGETRSGPDRRTRAACARFAISFVVSQINQWITLIRQPVNWLQFLGCDVSTLVSISDKLLPAWHPHWCSHWGNIPRIVNGKFIFGKEVTQAHSYQFPLKWQLCITIGGIWAMLPLEDRSVVLVFLYRWWENCPCPVCLMKQGFWWNCRIKRSAEEVFRQLVIELRHEHVYAGEAQTQIWISCIRAPSLTRIVSIEEKNFNETVWNI